MLSDAAHERRWHYASGMRDDEALLFMGWHSDPSSARFCPHTAFQDPGSSPGEREALDSRVLVFWADQAPAAGDGSAA